MHTKTIQKKDVYVVTMGEQVEFKVGFYRGALEAGTCFNIYKTFSYFISSYFINFDFKAHFLGVVGINT